MLYECSSLNSLHDSRLEKPSPRSSIWPISRGKWWKFALLVATSVFKSLREWKTILHPKRICEHFQILWWASQRQDSARYSRVLQRSLWLNRTASSKTQQLLEKFNRWDSLQWNQIAWTRFPIPGWTRRSILRDNSGHKEQKDNRRSSGQLHKARRFGGWQQIPLRAIQPKNKRSKADVLKRFIKDGSNKSKKVWIWLQYNAKTKSKWLLWISRNNQF